MIDSIKITSLNDIGSNLAANTIFPVVNVAVPFTNKANLQIIGNLILSGAGGSEFVQAAQANLAQSVVNSAQPNITSVGTLSISTLKISGGTSGYVLRTDGSGNLTWIAPTATVSGSNSQVQFNNAGSFGSSANFTYDNSNNILNVIRANASYLTAYESVSTANLSANGLATIARINVTNTANLGAVGNVTITGGSNGQVLTTNGNGVLSWKNDANSSYGNSNVVSLLASFGSNTIVTTGNVTANYFNGVATDVLVEAVNNNYSYHMAFVTGAGDTTLHMDNDDNLQYNPSDGTLTVTRVDATYVLADLQFSNGYPAANVTGLGNVATINLTGSNSNVLYGNGVFAAVAGGANTGNVTFDDVTVQGVNGLNLSAGADFTANLAYLQVRAGDVASHIHLDTGNNQAYDLIVGDDQNYVQVSSTGNILLSAYDSNTSQYTWTLDYNGNLILAGGNSVIQSIANSSLDPTLPNVSTMTLTPDANYNSQSLVLDPTAPGHIHLRAYAFSNIDEPAANIFLGGEDTAFEITSGANNQAVIHSNGKAWTFGDDGNISSDTLTFTTTYANYTTTEYQTAGIWEVYVDDFNTGPYEGYSRINVTFKDNQINKPQVYIENQAANTGVPYRWIFDENGNLTLPGDVVGPANANLTIYSNAGVHSFTFADDGTFYAPDNVVLGGTTISVGPNANTLNLANSTLVISSTSNAYIQAVINNVSDNGSADWVAQGHLGNDDGGWVDLGFTSSFYSDPDYTITGPGDGYVFTQAYLPSQAPAIGNGSLILATGENGDERDIIFGTGGFLTANIFGRISDANNALELSRASSNINLSGGGNIINANVISANSFVGNGSQLTGIPTQTTGNWTLAPGVNTVNLSVPINGTYSIWVRGNIPNGIVTYTATAVVTNTNVPVLGSSYGWYYEAGNALVLTSIPTQFVGTVNNISNAVVSTTTANVFTFGITNNSGNAAVVNWGYTEL